MTWTPRRFAAVVVAAFVVATLALAYLHRAPADFHYRIVGIHPTAQR